MSSPDETPRRPSTRPSRGLGDAPSLGRVSRMRRDTRSPEERGKPPHRPGSLRDFKFTLSIGLTVFLVCTGLVMAGLAIYGIMSSKRTVANSGDGSGTPVAGIAAPAKPLPPPPSELIQQVRDFLSARTPEVLAPLIRKSDQEPAAILAKLAKLEEIDGKVDRVTYLDPLHSRCVQIEAVLVQFVGKRNRLAMLCPDDEGRWRIDFDGFDRYASAPWDKIQSGEAAEYKVRVLVSHDSYYNGIFRDEEKWVCFLMQSADSDASMFCYAQRGSAQLKAMEEVLTKPADLATERSGRKLQQRMILKVRHPAEADPKQFEIVRVLSDEWSEGAKPLDEIVVEKPVAE